jgi:transketolase
MAIVSNNQLPLTIELIRELEIFTVKIRKAIVYQLSTFGFGHLGGSMSSAELMACLYGYILNVDPENPAWEGRDRLVLSKGHCGPALYAALALAGFIPYEELATLNQPNTRLPSHVDASKTPGVDMTTGSLGQGFSAALGMAHVFKIDQRANRVFAVLGDGECQEGQVWEAALYGAQYKLANFIGFVDANAEQFDRYIKDNIDIGDLAEKFRVFGWYALDVPNGHDVESILNAYREALNQTEKPSIIILHTRKGQGYPATDRLSKIHHITVSKPDAEEAFAFYDAKLSELEAAKN